LKTRLRFGFLFDIDNQTNPFLKRGTTITANFRLRVNSALHNYILRLIKTKLFVKGKK